MTMPVKRVYSFVNIQKTRVLIPKPACPLIKHTAVSMDSQTSRYAHSNTSHTYSLPLVRTYCLLPQIMPVRHTEHLFVLCLHRVYEETVFFQDRLLKILFYHFCFSYCNHDNGWWLLGTKTRAGPHEAG